MIEFKWYKNVISDDARLIREVVFQDEQGVLPEEEFDGSDKFCDSVVMYLDNMPIATGRIIIGNRGEAVLGRIACIASQRGKGHGKALVKELINKCINKGFDAIFIHSQTHARGFYKSLGFEEYGEVYMEAGIAHINMKLIIK